MAGTDVKATGSSYKVPFGSRGYLSETAVLDKENPAYFRPHLLGGSVTFDIDLSKHDGDCLAAVSLVALPAKGNPQHADIDGYSFCDADRVGESLCPEFDLMEANKESWSTTPHMCHAPDPDGVYSWCDSHGHCDISMTGMINIGDYGPDFPMIDTNKPFNFQIQFEAVNG